MDIEIFSDFGCTVLQRGARYLIQYDSGGSASWQKEAEISFAEVEKVKKSERDAYEVILAAELSGRSGDKK